MSTYAKDMFPADFDAVRNAQEAYRECVRACIGILKNRCITSLSKEEISWLGVSSSLEDVLQSFVSDELANLNESGVCLNIRGDDHAQFFDEMYSLLKGKEKSRVITNPATHQAVGAPL